MTRDEVLAQRIWFNTQQAAEFSGMHVQTIIVACQSGTLIAGQPSGRNGRWRIHRDDLDAWLRGERVAS